MVVAGLADGAFDRGVEKALHRRVEAVERHQGADLFSTDLFRRALECVERRAFAPREMHAGGAGLADRLKDFLHQSELIGSEGVAGRKVIDVRIGLERHSRVHERELVLQDVVLPLVGRSQRRDGTRVLFEKAFLDDLVYVGAREREPRLEAALDLRKVMLLGAMEIAEHGVEVFLRGHDYPGVPVADCAELLGNGLEVEHEMGVVSNEPTDLVHQKHYPVALALTVEIALHPFGEVLHREAEVILTAIDPFLNRAFTLPQRFH